MIGLCVADEAAATEVAVGVKAAVDSVGCSSTDYARPAATPLACCYTSSFERDPHSHRSSRFYLSCYRVRYCLRLLIVNMHFVNHNIAHWFRQNWLLLDNLIKVKNFGCY